MYYIIAAAIAFLAPHLERVTVRHYAKLIVKESAYYRLDPLLVVAYINVETSRTWNPALRSATNDMGLCQVHVSRTSNSHLRGFEEVLYMPSTNVHYGCGIIAMWRRYHERHCDGSDHHYVSHLKWGYRVKDTMHAEKVLRLYRSLLLRFRPGAGQEPGHEPKLPGQPEPLSLDQLDIRPERVQDGELGGRPVELTDSPPRYPHRLGDLAVGDPQMLQAEPEVARQPYTVARFDVPLGDLQGLLHTFTSTVLYDTAQDGRPA